MFARSGIDQGCQCCCRSLDTKAFTGQCLTGSSETFSLIRHLAEKLKRTRQRRHVARRHHEPVHVINNEVWNASNRCYDYGEPCSHRLNHRIRKTFGVTRQYEYIDSFVQRYLLVSGYPSGKRYVSLEPM